MRVGGIAQRQSICLACARTWTPSPAVQKQNKQRQKTRIEIEISKVQTTPTPTIALFLNVNQLDLHCLNKTLECSALGESYQPKRKDPMI